MTPDIKIRTLHGAGIKTYIPSIVKVQSEVLKECKRQNNKSQKALDFFQ